MTFAAFDTLRKLVPDILISFGGHSVCGIESLMKEANSEVEHWLINENGEFIDTYQSNSINYKITIKKRRLKCQIDRI